MGDSFSWPLYPLLTPIMDFLFFTKHNSLQVCTGTQKLRFMQKAYVDCLFPFKALEAIRKFH